MHRSKISVLHLLHRFTFGGTENVVINLVNHSTSSTRNFVCSLFENDKEFTSQLIDPENRVFTLNKKKGNDISAPIRIASLCRRLNIDIVHSLGWGTYAEGIVASKILSNRSKFIFSYRGKTYEDIIRIPKRRVFAQRLFAIFSDVILTNSSLSRKEYAKDIGVKPGKIRVIYNGVDTDKFKNIYTDRRAFGFSDKDIVIGTVARFDPVKNLNGLLEAFCLLKKKLKTNCKLFLVGDGPERASLKKLASDMEITNDVVFGGMRKDIPECLNVMNIYVQPSHFENIPNSLMEAMAIGLPVVATKVGGIVEVVENEKTGILVEPSNTWDTARAIEQLIEYPAKREQMGRFGKKRIETGFSIKKMVSAYEALYAELLKA